MMRVCCLIALLICVSGCKSPDSPTTTEQGKVVYITSPEPYGGPLFKRQADCETVASISKRASGRKLTHDESRQFDALTASENIEHALSEKKAEQLGQHSSGCQRVRIVEEPYQDAERWVPDEYITHDK